ncbi:MAG: hypothetical protein V1244_00225 [Nitrospinaceae bacterium]|jgi:hypothetical protein|nr:hypothetical protein [Nitrospinaceae bacterium]
MSDSWDEVEEIVGHWTDFTGIVHVWTTPISPSYIRDEDEILLKEVNAGTEKIPIKGKGYMMVTVQEYKGTLGTITVESDVKKLKYYRKTYKIAEHDINVVTGFNCDGEDLETDGSALDTVGKSISISINNRSNGKQIWPEF